MPTHRRDFVELSVSELAQLSGYQHRTCRQRLDRAGVKPMRRDGRTLYFNPREALRAIFLGSALDPSQEQARLAKERADAQALANAERRGEVVETSLVSTFLVGVISQSRARLLAVANRVAPAVAIETTAPACQKLIYDEITSALQALADSEVKVEQGGKPWVR